MKKITIFFLLSFLLIGCKSNEPAEEQKIIIPSIEDIKYVTADDLNVDERLSESESKTGYDLILEKGKNITKVERHEEVYNNNDKKIESETNTSFSFYINEYTEKVNTKSFGGDSFSERETIKQTWDVDRSEIRHVIRCTYDDSLAEPTIKFEKADYSYYEELVLNSFISLNYSMIGSLYHFGKGYIYLANAVSNISNNDSEYMNKKQYVSYYNDKYEFIYSTYCSYLCEKNLDSIPVETNIISRALTTYNYGTRTFIDEEANVSNYLNTHFCLWDASLKTKTANVKNNDVLSLDSFADNQVGHGSTIDENGEYLNSASHFETNNNDGLNAILNSISIDVVLLMNGECVKINVPFEYSIPEVESFLGYGYTSDDSNSLYYHFLPSNGFMEISFKISISGDMENYQIETSDAKINLKLKNSIGGVTIHL